MVQGPTEMGGIGRSMVAHVHTEPHATFHPRGSSFQWDGMIMTPPGGSTTQAATGGS